MTGTARFGVLAAAMMCAAMASPAGAEPPAAAVNPRPSCTPILAGLGLCAAAPSPPTMIDLRLADRDLPAPPPSSAPLPAMRPRGASAPRHWATGPGDQHGFDLHGSSGSGAAATVAIGLLFGLAEGK